MNEIAAARRRYAEDLRHRVHVRSEALVQAFAIVPREQYLGPGPWKIIEALPATYRDTPDADPRHLYHDVLVAIDATRLLNNGQPSAHASWIEALQLREGEHVVHVGCGTGYYTAIMAEVVGPGGRVTALDIDAELAERAQRNLADYRHVEVICGDGGEYDPCAADAIYVNAGATHPRQLWLDGLRIGGRLIVPLVRWPSNPDESSASGLGIMLKVTHHPSGDAAAIISLVGIFPCIGAVDAEADRHLAEALQRGVATNLVRSLRRDAHESEPGCWLHGNGFCLSTRPVAGAC